MTQYDVDVAILGAGTSGMAAYREVVKHTDRVALIDGGPLGTTCARVGCMPSKLLIAAADAAHEARHTDKFGVSTGEVTIDGVAVMDRVRRERDRFVGFVNDAVDSFEDRHLIRQHARFIDDTTLELADGSRLTARTVIIATGSRPIVPPPFKTAGDRLIVNDDVFDWQDLPRSAAVFGAGVIGLELGQALSRLGVRVHLFGLGNSVGPGVAEADGIDFQTMTQIVHPNFERVKNKRVEHDCTVLNNDKTRALTHHTAVFVDAWGREVQGTEKTYTFEHIITFNSDSGEITDWRQTWDLVDWDASRKKRDAQNDTHVFARNAQLYYDIMGAWGAGELGADNSKAKVS